MGIACGNLSMLGKHICVLLLCVSTLACSGGLPSDVPNAPSGPPDPTPDPAFCGKVGTDLLAALDGSWSLQQGAGVVFGGVLPPHPPAPIYFKYDPQRGLMNAQGYDLATEMVMFPVANEQQNFAEKQLKAVDTSKISKSSCDWDALPIFIGTTKYFFFADPGVARERVARKYLFCDTIEEGARRGEFPIPIEVASATEPILQTAFYEQCVRPYLDSQDDSSGMTMTLVVRFISSRYGLGTLSFKGKEKSAITIKGDSPFSYLYEGESVEMNFPYKAQAPVTLFR